MKDSIEMRIEVQEALYDFVMRVADGEAASDAEIAAMPEAARVLLESFGVC